MKLQAVKAWRGSTEDETYVWSDEKCTTLIERRPRREDEEPTDIWIDRSRVFVYACVYVLSGAPLGVRLDRSGVWWLLYRMYQDPSLLWWGSVVDDDDMPRSWFWGEMVVSDVEAHALMSGCFEMHIDALAAAYEQRQELGRQKMRQKEVKLKKCRT